jgi:UDP-glucose 4-epimerase
LLQIIEAHKIDAILHFAAKIVVPESIADPLACYLNNTVETRALLEAAMKGKVRYFVFSSSAAAYGNPNGATVNEETVPAPLSPYGMSKLMSEFMIRDVQRGSWSKACNLKIFQRGGGRPKGPPWSIYGQCHAPD